MEGEMKYPHFSEYKVSQGNGHLQSNMLGLKSRLSGEGVELEF